MNQQLYISILVALTVSFAALSTVDPKSESGPPVKENPGNVIKDTTVIHLESGRVEIGRECTESKNEAWTTSTLKMHPAIIAEAYEKRIQSEVVWVEIKKDEDCNYTHFSIPKPGKLNTLNTMARKLCSELILAMESGDLSNPFGCPTDECENIRIPISVQVY